MNKLSKNNDTKSTKKESILKKEIKFSDLKKNKSKKSKKDKILNSKDVNFLYRYEVVVDKKQPKVNPKVYLIPGVSVVSILIVIIIIMQIMLAINNKKNDSIKEYLNDPENISQYEVAQNLKEDISNKKGEISGIKNVLDTIDMYPNLDKSLVDVMFGTAGKQNVVINNINYSSQQGLLSIDCTTKDFNNVSKFVAALKKTDYFNIVTYVGYNGTSDTPEGGSYTFTVMCICKAN